MSIQWTLVAGVLYLEIVVVALLLLPFLRPRTWQKFFKSRFLRSIESQANLYFMVFIVILILLFLDSMREMTKYAGDLNTDGPGRHVDTELQHSMKLFRAQRNFYIAGFALFLFLVIRRLVTLITALAQLDIQAEAAMKQAKSASDAATNLMKDDKKGSGDKGASGDSKEVAKLKEKLEALTKELSKAVTNEEAMKRQAKNLTEEYDRLRAEHQKVVKDQKKAGDSKKDS